MGTDAGDIWAVGPDGSSRAIVEADVDQLSSAFSPDGKLVAYVSSESGANEIWVKAFPDGETRQMTREGGHSPVWSPDGERLYYRHNESGSIAVLNVSTGSGVGVSDGGLLPISIIDTPAWNRMYDIMPDGQRFLVVLPAGRTASAQTTPPSINIVLNWFEELKERVPVP